MAVGEGDERPWSWLVLASNQPDMLLSQSNVNTIQFHSANGASYH